MTCMSQRISGCSYWIPAMVALWKWIMLKLVRTIDSFEREGKKEQFNNPQGLYVSEKGDLLIADTDNQRVVHLNEQGQLVKVVAEPKSDLLQADFQFKPVRVVMDKGDRIYVMAAGVFDGFMEFSADGTFSSFIGANRVQVDPVEYLWKRFATREQRSQMVMFTPTEFTNLDMDEEGFIYATSGDRGKDPIKKLNAQGTDILRRQGYHYPQGDLMYTNEAGPSRLIDVDVGDSDMYSVLDSNRGRIFTYNGDGYLLHIFGGRAIGWVSLTHQLHWNVQETECLCWIRRSVRLRYSR